MKIAKLAFNSYENVRRRLPKAPAAKGKAKMLNSLLDLKEDYDVFLFDAFGVLNVGAQAIPRAVQTVHRLKELGKHCLVVSNAGGFSRQFYLKKFQNLGFSFQEADIITSREALLMSLDSYPSNMRWGLIGAREYQEDLAHLHIIDQDDADFFESDGFLFLTTARWNVLRQQDFIHHLLHAPRPILLANPDLIAPQGEDKVSFEAGSYGLLLPNRLYQHVRPFGKPFASIYDLAVARLRACGVKIVHERMVMIGDTLHTDILGGNAYGLHTVLALADGFVRGLNVADLMQQSAIYPDYMLERIGG